MISEKQLAANKGNAQKSTGPKTLEGKSVVRNNARKHGLLSKDIVISSGHAQESQEEFEDLVSELRQDLQPQGALEDLVVDKIAMTEWRLRRALRAEKGAIRSAVAWYLESRETTFAQNVRELEETPFISPSLANFPNGDYRARSARRKLQESARGLGYLIGVVTEVRSGFLEREKLERESHQRLIRCFGQEEGGVVARIRELIPDPGPRPHWKDNEIPPLAPADKEAALRVFDEEISDLNDRKQRMETEEAGELEAFVQRSSLPGDETGEHIQRYETMYERQFYRAVDQLKSLQRQRREI